MNTDFQKVREDFDELRRAADDLMEEVQKMKKAFTWGSWEPYTIKVYPKRINGRWYWPGDTVYRSHRFGPGGVHYRYGDHFDALRDIE